MQEAYPMYISGFFFSIMLHAVMGHMNNLNQIMKIQENSGILKRKSTGRNRIKSLKGRTAALSADPHLKLTFVTFINGTFQQTQETQLLDWTLCLT